LGAKNPKKGNVDLKVETKGVHHGTFCDLSGIIVSKTLITTGLSINIPTIDYYHLLLHLFFFI
jgi:hypothetical protein